jgi:DNA-directed RNA polymerase subunit RPC12/RpoP
MSLIVSFGLTPHGVKPSMGQFINKEGKRPGYICKTCGDDVSPENIIGYCMTCGGEFPPSSLHVPARSGGYYCSNCITDFSPEKSVKLSVVLSKLNTKGE